MIFTKIASYYDPRWSIDILVSLVYNNNMTVWYTMVHDVFFSDLLEGSNKSEKLQLMFEDWCQSNEDWHQSSFLLRIRTTHSNKVKGARRWLTEQAIAEKYKSAEIAKEIVAAKLNCEVMRKTSVRPHPDMPHRKDLQLYLCWDESFETSEVDTVVESLFEQRSTSKDSKDSKGDKKRKKSKRRSSSSSNSSYSSDASTSSSSSDSSAKKSKRKSKKNKDKKDKGSKKDKADRSKKKEQDAAKKAEQDRKKEEKEAEQERKREQKEAEQEKKKEQKEAEKEQKRVENERKKELRKADNEVRACGTKDTLWKRYVG